MKQSNFTKLTTVALALILTISASQLFAQTGNGIFFQAVARDNFSNPAKDRKIYVQTSIIQTTTTGTKLLTEEHQATTDATGVFNISIGNGTRVGGTASNLANINWSNGPFFLNLKVSITPIGASNSWDYSKEWIDMGTTSFGAVPYSYYAANVAGFDTKLNISDSTKYVTPAQLAAKTFDQTPINNAIAGKLNIADSVTKYITPTQLASYNFSSGAVSIDTSSLSNRINSKLSTSQLGIANGVASLNASGIIPSNQLPPVTLSSTSVVGSDADMVALSSATVGSIAIRTDLNKNYVLSASPASTLSNWVELLTPAAPVQTVNGYTGTVNLSKSDIGLSNVENTNDIAKPVSNATRTALDLKLDASKVGVASGVASLNALGKVPTDQIPAISFSSVKVLGSESEMLSLSSAVVGSVVIRTDVNKNFVLAVANSAIRSNWIELLTPAPPVQSVNGYSGNVSITKADLGLSDVNNTTDMNKPVSSATLIALGAKADTATVYPSLALKANIASPKFTGSVAIGTINPAAAAALDITSTTQGLLLPRLTYVQKMAIANPVAGLLLYCSDCGTAGEMQVYNGSSFVNMIGNAAQLALPIISATTVANSITSNAASSGGVITSDGGATITARGLVWGTATAPTIALATKTTDGTGVGTYTSSITGLTSGITYYARAYATNSVGTKYGSEITFNTAQAAPTLAATASTGSIGSTSAVSGGNITYNGGATVTVSGVVWSTTSTPTISLSTKTTNGATTGTYTSSLTGLAPGTLYYVRSYATNSVGTNYGAQTSFTTLNTATISVTASPTSITSNSATTGGDITADGGAAVTSRGVVYGTSAGSATFSVTSGTGTGTYTIGLTGLSPATTYFVRSFATNIVGTVYGAETNFTTIAIAPTLTTTASSSITKYTASAGGTITSNGGSAITASGICWSTTATPTTSDSKTTDGTNSGTFTSSLTGLTAGTTYFVRAYATNAIGTSYGTAQSFTTLSTPLAQTTVLIGTQRWTDKNLNVANYRNGDAITYAANAAQWASANAAGEGAYTYLKFASGDGGATYGKLYNWYAVNDSRGLAPNGYHIPTRAEWTTLRGTQPGNGKTLKSNTNDWSASFNNVNNFITYIPDANYSNYNGTNSTGFNALPGGSLFPNGTNGNYGSASFWTATIDPLNSAKANWTYFHSTYLYDGADCCNTYEIGNGMAIRLVKDDNSIETSPTYPILTSTTTATSITANSAILGGIITDEGATQVSVRGLVYGTTTGSSTFSVTIGSGGGTFTGTLTGLTQGTKYFVRSYATNFQGTAYGAETSFTTQTTPTVSVTATPSSLTTTSAIGGGTISSTGGAAITTSGLVWDANTNPTISLTTKTTDGTTSGTFTSSITGLTQGATYHVRAYATNSIGTSYGPDVTFTTVTTPTISSTATVTSITGTTATGGGTISSDGGASVTSRGLVWGTTAGSSTYSVTSGSGSGTYAASITGLSIATNYFVRAFATNIAGTVYGPEVQFATPSTATVASTITSTITSSTAVLGGVLSSTGGATTTIGIIYSTSSSFGTYSTTTINANAVAGTYTTTISGLSELTNYYVKAYATNTAGTTYGPTINFSTPAVPAILGGQYQGGTVAYIYKSGDPGYIAGETHGIVMSNSFVNPTSATRWSGEANPIATNAIGQALGTGLTNSNTIYNAIGSNAIAVNLCRNYSVVSNGVTYTNWYLPSITEWTKIFNTRLGGFLPSFDFTRDANFTNVVNVWTSSETSASDVIMINIGNGGYFSVTKTLNINDYGYIRAIRYF